jgi:DNA-binding transcriptional MerR regulator
MTSLATLVASSSISSGREYTIGDLAREFRVTHRTLRFYEDRGLVTPRRQGTARFYSHRDRARLSKVLKAKQLGFTLTEIKVMVASEESASEPISLPLSTVEEQISHLERQHLEIEAALAELRTLRASLTHAA